MFAYDTERLEQRNDDAALEAQLDGISDGYDGKPLMPGMSWEYVRGFAEGMLQANKEQQEKVARFKEKVAREDAINRCECDWRNFVMDGNDEPTLGYEEMEEEPNLIVGSEEIVIEFPDGTSCIHYFDADTEF